MKSAATHSDTPALVVERLGKRFGRKTALDDVSFTAPAGAFTVILGPAGAGKTTTLRAIAGLESPETGRLTLNGYDVGGWEPKDRDVAMIFDNLALYPNKNGFENIASPLVIRGESKDVIKEKVEKMASTLRVSHILGRLPKTMSGGERQRIALGRALIRTPSLFLLDEPLSSLDAKLRIELRAELRRLQREHGYTFLMATPDFHEALAIADTVIMLRQGRVMQIAPPQEIYDAPVDREVALFVGAPQINLVPARYEADSRGGRILAADATLPVPSQFGSLFDGQLADDAAFELGVRPENLRLAAPENGRIRGTIIDIEPLGLKSVLTVQNDAAELRLVVVSADIVGTATGQQVGLDLVNASMLLAFDSASGQRLGHSRETS